jgi:hypothetical protein
VLQYLNDEPKRWEDVLQAADGVIAASEGTLNSVRTELAQTGQIVQVGRGRSARWKLGSSESENE